MEVEMKTRFSVVALAGALLLPVLDAQAQTAAAADDWKFSVMPYLWLPAVDGKFRFGPPPVNGGSANVELDAGNYLDSLEFAAMISGIARKGRWSIGSDLIYLSFSNTESKVKSVDLNPGSGPVNVSTSSLNAGASADLKGTVWTVAGGYALVQEPKANLEVLGGFRYLGLDVDSNWQLTTTVTGTGPLGNTATFGRSGSADKRENIWAGIVGARGRFNFGESDWFANAYVDVGGGSSVFTWQGVAGIGYAFKWGDVILDYRYLYYSQDDDKLIDDLSFGGLALGVNFRF
jgi:opacity protein-like surface antigen